MKVLLVNPGSDIKIVFPPLGLLYLAAYARSRLEGLEFKILDAKLKKLSIPEVGEIARGYRPDLVGIYGITINSRAVHDLAKELRPHTRHIAVGGPYATASFSSIVEDPNIDFVVAGEGEIPFYRLLKALAAGTVDGIPAIPRLASKSRPLPVYDPDADRIDDLDALPLPAWDLLDVEEYFKGRKAITMNSVATSRRVLPIFTSRGCPYQCYYCHNTFGKRFRARSAVNIVSEIAYLVGRYRIKEIEVEDDVFNLAPPRIFALRESLRAENLTVRISLTNGIRGDILTPGIIDALRDCGVFRINFGIETASERLQKMIGKNLNLEKTREMVRYAARSGMLVGGYFMTGFPGETRKELEETFRYAQALPFDIASFFIITPYENTAVFKSLDHGTQEKYLALSMDKQLGYHNASHSLGEVAPEDLRKLIRKANAAFYFNPKRIWRLTRKIKFRQLAANFLNFALFLVDEKSRL